MSDLYEKYGLEMEDEGAPADTLPESQEKTVIKKKGGWLRAILALFLGIIIGIGSVVGGGYLALTLPAGTTLQTISGIAGLNYDEQIKNKFLAEEYEDKSLLDVSKELLTVATDKNLAGVSKVVPAVGDYLDKMVTNMNESFGIELNTDTLLATQFAALPTYLGNVFRTTPLGNMLKATSKVEKLEPILMEVCYGEEGVHYHFDENGEVVMNEGYQAATFETFGTNPNEMINKISLAAVLPPSANDTLMLAMAYGRENVTFKLEKNADGTVKVDEKGHPIVTMLPLYFEEKGGYFYDYNGDPVSCTLKTLENGFIQMNKAPAYEGAGTQIYYLKQGTDGKFYAYKEPSDTAEPATFKKTMIGDLSANSSAMINNIYLKDALNVKYGEDPANDPHKILFSLAYGTENVDYKVDPVTREIKMIGDAQPRTIGDLRERGTDIINDVALSDIMSAAPNDALSMYLLYGKKGIHYNLDSSNNVIMLQKYIAISDDGTCVYNEYGEALTKKTETIPGYSINATTFTDINGISYTYQVASPEKRIDTNDGGNAKIYYLSIEGSPATFNKHSLGELAGGDNLISRLTDRLSLKEVLHDADLDNNKFLKHVSDCPINKVPSTLMTLAFTDMFSEEVYGADAIKHEGDTPLTAYNGDLINKGDYYTEDATGYHKAELNGKWWYLLNDPSGAKKPGDYKIATDMNELLNNMTTNVEGATLSKLHNDSIITGLGSLIGKDIKRLPTEPDIPGVPSTATTLGELTVTEMLHYTDYIMGKVTF